MISLEKYTFLFKIVKYYVVHLVFFQIDSDMVQHLDRNLHIGGAVKEVYDELVKTLENDYLRFDLVIKFFKNFYQSLNNF